MKKHKHLLCLLALSVMVMVPNGSNAGPQQTLSPDELGALLEKAETPVDHMKLAEHYIADAERLEKSAERHKAMAARYRSKNLPPKVAPRRRGMVGHCESLAQSLQNAAKAARQLGDMHKKMAEDLGQ